MKTIAQQLGVTEFPFTIEDSKGREIYHEDSEGFYCKKRYDSEKGIVHYEDSEGQSFSISYDESIIY